MLRPTAKEEVPGMLAGHQQSNINLLVLTLRLMAKEEVLGTTAG